MNSLILNRDFTHPSDGWYNIEAKGEHPNAPAGVVQVIDDAATQTIVSRFNADAAEGKLRHGNEMLIDHEHFKDQPDQETRAYGWLTQLQNRDDGIYGRIRWTTTGKAAVDGGDYRFFSTEYDPADVKIVNTGKSKKVRPFRLGGLSLTNMNNNRGQKPITNRDPNFPGATAPGDSNQPNNQGKKMKSVCTLLGLSLDAAEDAVHAEVAKLKNRGEITPADLTTLQARKTELETENETLMGEQIEALLDAHGVTEEKVRNRLKPTLVGYKDRAERVSALADFGFKLVEAGQTETAQQRQLRNRDTRQPDKTKVDGLDEKELAQKSEAEVQDYKIRNRCSYAEARNAVRSAKPELFGLK